jgi:nitrogen-specific signal transduction histidine kinase
MRERLSDPSQSTEEVPSQAAWSFVGLRRVLGHELPNQLTALQGLLHLLHLEEKERLSEAGRDYVQRCLVLCQRWQRLLELLRSGLQGLLATPEDREDFVLSDVLREVVAEVRQLLPARPPLECRLQLEVPKVRALRTLFPDLLRELVRDLGETLGPAGGEIHLCSQAAGAGVELQLTGHAAQAPAAAPAPAGGPRWAEQALLQDLAVLCGGELVRLSAAVPGYRLRLDGRTRFASTRTPVP